VVHNTPFSRAINSHAPACRAPGLYVGPAVDARNFILLRAIFTVGEPIGLVGPINLTALESDRPTSLARDWRPVPYTIYGGGRSTAGAVSACIQLGRELGRQRYFRYAVEIAGPALVPCALAIGRSGYAAGVGAERLLGGGAGLDWGSAAAWYPRGFRPWGRRLVFGFLMEDITVTELRRRMIEDMQLAGLSQGTQDAYVRVVRQLAGHFRLSPDRLTERQLRDYLMHLREVRNVAKGTFQAHFFGIKFLFVNTLACDWPLLTKKKSANPIANACQTFEVTRTAAA